uniref:hypothetical protein n=1 Tax=Gelidibacter japonicus TaxID=1962232 RepID=UPI003A9052FE
MTKSYLPRDQRQAISFCLTERDIEILKAVNRYRYMTCFENSGPADKLLLSLERKYYDETQ